MTIELTREERAQAIASIERWFAEERDERLGNLAAGALLAFFLEEVGPAVYNRAVADVQARLAQRVAEVDIECHAEPFGYWPAREKQTLPPRRRPAR